MTNSRQLIDSHAAPFRNECPEEVIEIYSRNVDGSLRKNCPAAFEYIGVDFERCKV